MGGHSRAFLGDDHCRLGLWHAFCSAGAAALYGAAFGLFPIGWIVLNAIFIYDISVKTGHFETVKHSIAGLAADRRLQLLLIAFSFGAFIEGAAGFRHPGRDLERHADRTGVPAASGRRVLR